FNASGPPYSRNTTAFISGPVAACTEKTATAANAITVSGRKIRMRPASPARLFKASEKITSVFFVNARFDHREHGARREINSVCLRQLCASAVKNPSDRLDFLLSCV